MADMNKIAEKKAQSEKEIDDFVAAQADDESSWDQSIQVRRTASSTMRIPSELAARAAFFAKLHRQTSVEECLSKIVKERLEMEEAAFASLKREMAFKTNG